MHTLATQVTEQRLANGAIYPGFDQLRPVTRAIALAVANAARDLELSALGPGVDLEAEIDAAMWWPDYVPYLPSEDRRSRHD